MTISRAYAPATVANLGVGFDVLGLAVAEPGDIVEAEWCDEPGAHLVQVVGDGGRLPRDTRRNTATVAANSFLKQINARQGVKLRLQKNLPLASGLGSSAASAVAAVVAVNGLLQQPLAWQELLPAALDGEAAVSGYHADNVAPCLIGGLTLVGGIRAEQIGRLPIPERLMLALVTPDVEVPTSKARAALPTHIPLKQMVSQTAAVAQLIDALYRNDLEALAAAMEADSVVEPARAHLMPLLSEMRQVAKANGALGLVISGAGPTLCAVCDDAVVSQRVAAAMSAAYQAAGIGARQMSTCVSTSGAYLMPALASS